MLGDRRLSVASPARVFHAVYEQLGELRHQHRLRLGHAGPEATSYAETLRELALRGMELAAEQPEQGVVGAERLAILHSLTSTCRLQGVHPYTYLVDVLQRISIHPDSAVEALTPRRWKALFAADPLRSDLQFTVNNGP